MKKVEIFTDFDGTITEKDCLEYLLNKFAHTSWLDIEDKVLRGSMSEIEALQAEFDLIRTSKQTAVDTLLKEISIDKGFKGFLKSAAEMNISVSVLSGGFTDFIEAIFRRENIEGLSITANGFSIENERWKIIKADVKRLCNQCNHCKTSSIIESASEGNSVIYIGDGTTDRCAALFSNFVFAKGSLLDFCVDHNIHHMVFRDFDFITGVLREVVKNIDKYKPLYDVNYTAYPPNEVSTST